MKQVLLFLSDKSYKPILDSYLSIQKVRKDFGKLVFIFHQKEQEIPRIINEQDPFIFTNDILNELPYKPFKDSLVHGNCHFPVLKFYLENPNYSYYWFIEDNIRFNGDW